MPTRAAHRHPDPFAAFRDKYPALVSYPQAEEITQTSVRTLKRLTASGELPCYRVGRTRTYRLRLDDVLALLQPVAGSAA